MYVYDLLMIHDTWLFEIIFHLLSSTLKRKHSFSSYFIFSVSVVTIKNGDCKVVVSMFDGGIHSARINQKNNKHDAINNIFFIQKEKYKQLPNKEVV